jgi:hypothetical protein
MAVSRVLSSGGPASDEADASPTRMPFLVRREVAPLLAALISVPMPEGRYSAPALTPRQRRQQTLDSWWLGWSRKQTAARSSGCLIRIISHGIADEPHIEERSPGNHPSYPVPGYDERVKP